MKQANVTFMRLNELMRYLQQQGCYPAVSFRGMDGKKPVWRAHVNGAGNHWQEASTPLIAMRRAARSWQKAGNPMDGYGAQSQESDQL